MGALGFHRLRVQRPVLLRVRGRHFAAAVAHGLAARIAAIADLHACDPWMSLDRINRSSPAPTR
jgi:hypothetical protein